MSNSKAVKIVLLVLGIGWAGLWQQVGAQQGASQASQPHSMHQHKSNSAPANATADAPAGHMSIPDVPVITQDGAPLHFYTDLVRGKVVAVNFIFTTCTTICPPLAATFGNVQRLMGDRVGRDVHLISITVDPRTDTPPRLKAWAAKFGAGPGWTLVTGRKEEIDRLLKALNAFTPDKQSHSPLVLIGNDARDSWTRAYGLMPAKKLASLLEAARGELREEAREARP